MNLGEKIYALRTARNLSQGDLAEALDVSRQSISKWETGGSVPELDKLIKLSEVFGVSLDELILNKQPSAPTLPPEPQVVYVEHSQAPSGKRIAGVILLCFSALVWLLVSLLGDVAAGLIIAVPFLGCGLICLFVRQNTGLWCLWLVYIFADLFLRFATSANLLFVFLPRMYMGGHVHHLIIAWLNLIIFAALVVTTVLRFRHLLPKTVRGNAIGAAVSWGAYLILWVALAIPAAINAGEAVVFSTPYRIVSVVSGWIKTILIAAALVFTVRLILSIIKNKKSSEP